MKDHERCDYQKPPRNDLTDIGIPQITRNNASNTEQHDSNQRTIPEIVAVGRKPGNDVIGREFGNDSGRKAECYVTSLVEGVPGRLYGCDKKKSKLTASYWACKDLWAGAGGSTKSNPKGIKGKY